MPTVLDRAESRAAAVFGGRFGLLAVLALMLVLALPGFFTLPPVDRDEVLFSQASSQMLASGDVVDIRFADQPRYKKPVGIYWLQAATAALTGHPEAIASFRLVSLAGALLAVGLTFAIARRLMPPAWAAVAALALGASLLMGAEARLAKTDAMLLATVMVCQAVLARAFLPGGRMQRPDLTTASVLTFWLGMAASVLVKGPIGPMVVGFTLAGLCLYRRDAAILRALRPVWGLPLLLVLVLPWVIAITLRSHGTFWTASVGHDLIGKLAEGQESHGQPPGTYLAALWLTFWPGAMLLLPVLPAIWAARRDPLVIFAAIWIVPTWIVFEITKTKLVHYVLPTYPALALLVAFGLQQARQWRWAVWLPALVAPALVAALSLAASRYGLDLPWQFWPLALALLIAAVIVALAYRAGRPAMMALSMAAAGLALSSMVYPTLARMPNLWPAPLLAHLAAEHPGCKLTVAGYGEPSLIFLTRQGAELATPEDALTALSAPGCQLVALPADAAQPPADPLARFDGLNIGSGRALHLLIYLKPN